MRFARLDLESKLLFVAIGTCIWGAVQLVRPVSAPHWVCVISVVAIGALLATLCSANGPHAVARFGVLAVCFGTASLVSLFEAKDYIWVSVFALFAVSFAGSAFVRSRETKRERSIADTSN